MSLYICDDVRSEGLGSLESVSNLPNKINDLDLFKYKNFLLINYNRESILNENDTKLRSFTKELSCLYNFKLLGFNQNTLYFKFKNFHSNYNFLSLDGLKITQNFDEKSFSFNSMVFRNFNFNIGQDNSGNFYGFSLSPIQNIKFGYKSFSRSMDIDSILYKDSSIAKFSFAPNEKVKKLSFNLNISDNFLLDIASETQNRANEEMTFSIFPLQKVKATYSFLRRELDYDEDIYIDEKNDGTFNSNTIFIKQSFILCFSSGIKKIFTGVKTSEFNLNASGEIKNTNFLNLWEKFLADKELYKGNYLFKTTQYHIGIENKLIQNLIYRGGIQYILTGPDGNLEYWEPFPFISLGKINKTDIPFSYTKANFLGISSGFTYNIGLIEINYGISQLLPLEIKSSETNKSGIKKFSGNDFFKKIKNDPGGNVQTIEVIWYF
ncbi:hypothetical protein HY745_13450 [Candidatus Desantisbacteria bacterium]|nr:hypothetical protein [Candidatus Desantisbacteria bacterium]